MVSFEDSCPGHKRRKQAQHEVSELEGRHFPKVVFATLPVIKLGQMHVQQTSPRFQSAPCPKIVFEVWVNERLGFRREGHGGQCSQLSLSTGK